MPRLTAHGQPVRQPDPRWFAMTDADRPRVRDAVRARLAPSVHDVRGRQLRPPDALREDRR